MTSIETPAPVPAEPSPPASAQSIDRVFEYAWHRCNAFDDRSGQLKKRYRLIREAIVFITWFTTLLAVLAALNDDIVKLLNLLIFLLPVMTIGYTLVTIRYAQLKVSSLPDIVRAYGRNVIDRRYELLILIGIFLLAIFLTWAAMGFPPLPEVVAVVQANSTPGQTDTTAYTNIHRDNLIKIALIILPLLSAGMLTFASRFETGIAWVGFRLVSESIRRKIYELRVKRSLEPLTQDDLEDLRTHVLTQRAMLDEMGIVTPLWGEQYQPDGDFVRPLWTDVEEDDGYAPLPLDCYVSYRVVPQTNYYRRRIQSDYGKTRNYRGWILFIGALGAFLAAVDYGEFVAVTVAGVTALQAHLSLREHEHSYNIHVRTLLLLEDRIASYYIQLKHIIGKTNYDEMERQTILDYVESVENILDEERAMWKNSVLQGQEATESSIAQLVNRAAPDFEIEEGIEEVVDDSYQSFYTITAVDEREKPDEVEEAEEAAPADESSVIDAAASAVDELVDDAQEVIEEILEDDEIPG